MTQSISIRQAGGTWVIRTGGAVIAETKSALELSRGDTAPIIFFPRTDIAMAFLEPSQTQKSTMGSATYFTIHTKSGQIDDAAWSYDAPNENAVEIAGCLAFDGEKVTVEQL